LLLIAVLRWKQWPQSSVFWALLYSLAFTCGLAYLHWHAFDALSARIPARYSSVWLEGEVRSAPEQQGDRRRFIFLASQIDHSKTLHNKNAHQLRPENQQPKAPELACLPACKLRVDWYRSEEQPTLGSRWRFELKLQPPYAPLNHAGFDAEKVALAKGIHGYGVVQSGQRLVADVPVRPWQAWREGVLIDIKRQFPADVAALLSALLLGERADLSREQWQQFADTGTSHLVAISGLHIGLIASVIFVLARRIFVCFPTLLLMLPAQWWALLTALLGASVYAALANFLLPTQRALATMACLLLLAISRREPSLARLFAWVLLVVVLLSPLAVLNPGFYLSFAAVGLLIYGFHQRPLPWFQASGEAIGTSGLDVADNRPLWRRAFSALALLVVRLLKVQLVLIVGLMPLTLLFFQQFSLIGLLANVFAVPLISVLILPLAMFYLLMMSIGLEFGLLQMALTTLVELLLNGIAVFADVPHGVFTRYVTPFAACWAGIGAIWLLAPAGMPLRWLSLACFLPLFFVPNDKLAPGDFWLYQLDVGQGSALAIRTKNHVMLYDTGPGDGRGADWVAATMVPTLRVWGRNDIDLLMISHTDLDHAGGKLSAVNAWRPKRILASGTLENALPCRRGQQWHWDGVDFKVIHPGPNLPYLGNDSSCVLSIRSPAAHVLLPGDLGVAAEATALQWLRQQQPESQEESTFAADVLVLGHHGSRGSSGTKWLAALKPRLALISRGAHNRFGFPHKEVLQRLQSVPTPWLDSAICGGLELRLSTQTPELAIKAARNESRWWRAASSCTVPLLTQER
jgi:competence protein ComEC